MGTQPKSGRLLWRLFTYVVLASAMPAAGGDLDAAGAAVERGRFEVGFQRVCWASWGFGVSFDPSRGILVANEF
jgi:hypothetical protein